MIFSAGPWRVAIHKNIICYVDVRRDRQCTVDRHNGRSGRQALAPLGRAKRRSGKFWGKNGLRYIVGLAGIAPFHRPAPRTHSTPRTPRTRPPHPFLTPHPPPVTPSPHSPLFFSPSSSPLYPSSSNTLRVSSGSLSIKMISGLLSAQR
jgi:hypothetical protein